MQNQDTQTTETSDQTFGETSAQGMNEVKHIKKIEAKPAAETTVKTGLACVPVGT